MQVDDGVATITLRNAARRNAVDAAMREGLEAAYGRIADDDAIRAVVITGEGDKAFCAGGDINGYQAINAFGPDGVGPPPIPKPTAHSKPFIAAIRGYAVGGGFALALSCDLRVVGRGARLGATGLWRGAMQAAGQSQRLPRLIGTSKALEMMLLGTLVSGEDATASGLANIVVDDDDVITQATQWARTIAGYSPEAVAHTKRLAWAAFDQSLDEGLAIESQHALDAYRSAEAQAGFAAFLEGEGGEQR
ncbi:enoyl-CoA hydratase/isomerase family protein [Gordonia terrae]